MPLQSVGFATHPDSMPKLRPHPGTHASCAARRCDIQHPCAIRMPLLSAVIRHSALALSMHYQR